MLAFPHKTETPIGTVWSERQLSPALLDEVAGQTAARLATSPLAERQETRPVFITDGGWRWLWLANTSQGAFALTRPFSSAVIVNATDPETGVIDNRRPIGGKRKLAPVLAHEFTHGMIRREFGLHTLTFPQWKIEGYCDHVAGESSLDAAAVGELEAAGTDHPALPYYYGRLRVAEILAANGGSVENLFMQEH